MAGFATEMPPGWDVSEGEKAAVPNTTILWNFMARMGTGIMFMCKKLECSDQLHQQMM